MARFINADAYAATGIGLLGNNMYIYCNNNPISYIDSTGKTLRKAVTAICMVSEGSHRIPDVGNGNYSNFEEEYMEIAVPTINSVITRSQANQYYDTIKAGDYSQMINPLDCFDLFSYFDEMKGADYVEILLCHQHSG